jgi:hypothetical protein
MSKPSFQNYFCEALLDASIYFYCFDLFIKGILTLYGEEVFFQLLSS